ncbi:PilN domain-containing protein [Pontiella agarivorans]|uniref:PilN domain-containing protein n=1 Tax=Pontiella agarivorans TaxID=3038953 RepID=UPI002AD306AE|nr:PilN domain-containing protein [Pontiella agarivorans]
MKISQEGTEPVSQNRLDIDLPDSLASEDLETNDFPNFADNFKGEVTVAVQASALLMRTMDFPSTDPQEVADMVGFQIDKISPFPIDLLAVSHEMLSVGADTSRVLMSAVRREQINHIGEVFEKHGIRIHSIDARVLGWLNLLQHEKRLTGNECEIIVIDDGIDLVLAVLHNGQPLTFRPLAGSLNDPEIPAELAYEFSYTLTTLDAEYDLPAPENIHFWTLEHLPPVFVSELSEKTGVTIENSTLAELPPLSEGILRRTLSAEPHIELIPAEWLEQEKNRKMRKQFAILTGSIAAVWLSILLIFLSVFKIRDMKLASVQKEAAAIAPLAAQAAQNKNKLEKLKAASDRTYSSLECLREATRLLPAGDIEFVSYNYSKDKGVTLRGTGRDKSIITDFYTTLNKSDLFDGVRNESVTEKTTKGVRRAVFSVTLPLSRKEESS